MLSETLGREWGRRKAALMKAPNQAADLIVDRMQDAVSGPSPSRPGSPPGLASGTLRASIHAVHGDGKAEVRVDAPYGDYLEHGTSRMAARPFFHDTIEDTRDEARRMILGTE